MSTSSNCSPSTSTPFPTGVTSCTRVMRKSSVHFAGKFVRNASHEAFKCSPTRRRGGNCPSNSSFGSKGPRWVSTMDLGALRIHCSGTEAPNAPGAEISSIGVSLNTVSSMAAPRCPARSMSSSAAHSPRGPAPMMATFICYAPLRSTRRALLLPTRNRHGICRDARRIRQKLRRTCAPP